MEKLAKPLAIFALLLTIGPPAWLLASGLASAPANAGAAASPPVAAARDEGHEASNALMTEGRMKVLMSVGAVLWFVAAPYWLKEDAPAEQIIEAPGRQAVP